jgi:hypothetical protein
MRLDELQQEVALAFSDQGGVPPCVASPDAVERMDIYRGTVRAALVKALSLNFPAAQRLVGAEFFEWAAALYALDHLPTAANLDGYGDRFADFLAKLPGCAQFEYLGDVARLDWAVARALHAEDADAVRPGSLAAVSAEAESLVFEAHPAVSLIGCRHPADEIWSAVLNGDPGAFEHVDLASGPCWLLVERRALRPYVGRLTQREWEFASGVLSGKRLGDALARVSDGAAPKWLAQHLAAGRIVGWRITSPERRA